MMTTIGTRKARPRAPRRLAAALCAAATLATAPAQAAGACLQPAERSAFQVHSLQSLLMVAALNCRQEDSYNGFVMRFRKDLGGAYRAVAAHFRRTGGGTRKLDEHITSLANAHSQDGIRQGSLFCQNVAPVWQQVMALRGGAELAGFAETRGVTQIYDPGTCPAAPPSRGAQPPQRSAEGAQAATRVVAAAQHR
jgi:hypothetical protein